jgi:hypothetical protein
MNGSRGFLELDGELELSSDPARLDRALIHEYLAGAINSRGARV